MGRELSSIARYYLFLRGREPSSIAHNNNGGRELGSIAQFLGGKNIYRTTIWDGREQSSIAL